VQHKGKKNRRTLFTRVLNPSSLAEHHRKIGEQRALFEHVAPQVIVRVAQRPIFRGAQGTVRSTARDSGSLFFRLFLLAEQKK
jgi:hypothetical protein